MLSRLFNILAFLALGCFLLFFAFHSWQVLLFPYQVEYGEGPVLAWSRLLAQGQLPYKAIQPFPWSFSVYTPAYMAVSGALIRLFPTAPWFGGRLLSLLSGLGLAGLLLLSQYPAHLPSERIKHGQAQGLSKKGSWLWVPFGAWLAALLWLASPYLFRWATFYRPDLFALLWSAVGILLVQRAVIRERASLLGVAACCFVFSFYSKQSFFAAPVASMIYLWLVRRAWLPRLVTSGALGGGVVAVILWLMSGQALFDNLIAANANPFSWQALWDFERSFFGMTWFIMWLAIWQIIKTWRASRTSSSSDSSNLADYAPLLAIYAILSMLVTFSVGKAGAWENYFLEPLWVICALAGQVMSEWWSKGNRFSLLVPLLVLFQLLFFLRGFERYTPAAEWAWLADLREESAGLQAGVNALPSDAVVWSEQMGVLGETGRMVPLHSFVYTQLAHQGLWESTPLIERLAAGDAALLIQQHNALVDPLHTDRWSRPMLDASERGYTIGQLAGRLRLRQPLPFAAKDDIMPLESGIELVNWMALAGNGENKPLRQDSILSAPVELPEGDALTLHLLWRSPEAQADALSVSVQLFAPSGERLAQHDAPLRDKLGGTWPKDALVRDEHTLILSNLPNSLPAGGYGVQVSLYESETGTSRGTITLPRFKISPPAPEGTLAVSRNTSFGDTLRLLSHDALPTSVKVNDTLTLHLRWQAQQPTSQPLTAFLHLIAPDGTLAAQTDFTPPYPPFLWSTNEEVQIPYTLHLPDTLLPNTYELRLGWYDPITFERLPAQAEDAIDGALRLGELRVE